MNLGRKPAYSILSTWQDDNVISGSRSCLQEQKSNGCSEEQNSARSMLFQALSYLLTTSFLFPFQNINGFRSPINLSRG